MSSEGNDQVNHATRVELKYCEHCGGLYIREPGAGVYCGKCQAKVAELPKPTHQKRRLVLPVRERTALECCTFHADNDPGDFEAAGGAS